MNFRPTEIRERRSKSWELTERFIRCGGMANSDRLGALATMVSVPRPLSAHARLARTAVLNVEEEAGEAEAAV